ncbi:MAG TPA: phenylalanine 4-monooxygenase [Thermoleophilaceae bacterium]|jgi:phenylalanine-4-hydroxylase|nr:phenylalanine 4-monooxygenase [Thermoleophilaceae bacterium]
MFEEAQLYSPVTDDGDGVTVHLAHDHPGANDPEYRERRNEIAALALAWKPGEPAPPVEYNEDEQEVWRTVCRELAPKHERLAIHEFLEAKAALDLPTDGVPTLDLVSERLRPITGFYYVPAAGLVPLREFYGSLSELMFHSTQYVRHPAEPLYTPEPDIIHEVFGHGHLLATPTFSELHRLTGEATHRLQDEENLRFLSRVFWFTVEFGVVVEDGELKAYGAGILSSYGEIDEFRGMEHRPIDLAEMGTADYDITQYQPVLYRAESLDEVREVVGGFFATCTDESIDEMRARVGAASV